MLPLSAIDSDSKFGRGMSDEVVGDAVLFACDKLAVNSELGDLANVRGWRSLITLSDSHQSDSSAPVTEITPAAAFNPNRRTQI
jgi:hypothetical protein